MKHSESGGMTVHLAEGATDRAAILGLRARCFPHRGSGREQWEVYDALCHQLIVRGPEGSGEADEATGSPKARGRAGTGERLAGSALASLRVLIAPVEVVVEQGYSAGFYDLSPLRAIPGPVAEVGRLCLAPGPRSWEALRLLLATLARLVDDAGAGLMLGCTSFPGADWRRHRPALALLAAGHLGPARLLPFRRAAEVVDYPRLAGPVSTEGRATPAALPPLLRSYLAMGGWVSDHAVADRDLDTLHVLTCVEVGGIRAARAARLRALARETGKGAPG